LAVTLNPGPYTFTVESGSASSGEVLFEATIGGNALAAGKTLGSRATISAGAPLYGGFQVASSGQHQIYLLVRGESLRTLGITSNNMDRARLQFFNGQGQLQVSANACSGPAADYYRFVRGAPASPNDVCWSIGGFVASGAYTFSVTPDSSGFRQSGEVLFEVAIDP
jgi:hypothetical protein